MMRRRLAAAAQSLLFASAAAIAVGEGSERYDAARHVDYAARWLQQRKRRLRDARDSDASEAHWLQRETPKFPYVLAISAADNPAVVARAVLGSSDHVIGSSAESTSTTLDAVVAPTSPGDAFVHRVAKQWRELKMQLHGEVPTAFNPQRRVVKRRLDVVLAALRQASIAESEDKQEGSGDGKEAISASAGFDKLVFFLRDFDGWDDATTTMWLQWVHDVTSDGLAHVVLPTATAVTPGAIREWQRLHKIPDTDFVAILLRAATGTDQTTSLEKLKALNEKFGLDLRGLDENDAEKDDIIGYESPSVPTEVSVIMDLVGNWWSDLEVVCRELEKRGLGSIDNSEERLALVHEVCEDHEREMIHHVSSTIGIHELTERDQPDNRDRRISSLQAWKCLEVVTGLNSEGQIIASPQKLLQRDGDKPINCATPVEALLPFQQRPHGEAKFMDLIDNSILFLRPKNAVEIGVVPCDATALVGPCWVETRPIVKRAFEKLWRDDAYYLKVLELERFEDNHKLMEEIAIFEQEIRERRQEFDAQTREFIMIQHSMKKDKVALRKAELALLELEIQSKLVYLERLRGLLD